MKTVRVKQIKELAAGEAFVILSDGFTVTVDAWVARDFDELHGLLMRVYGYHLARPIPRPRLPRWLARLVLWIFFTEA